MVRGRMSTLLACSLIVDRRSLSARRAPAAIADRGAFVATRKPSADQSAVELARKFAEAALLELGSRGAIDASVRYSLVESLESNRTSLRIFW